MALRTPIIAGNWKLNTDLTSAVSLSKAIASATKDINTKDIEVVVFPPFPFIRDVYLESEPRVSVGAQACYVEDKGAYTGAISPIMLKSIGCKYVLVGHSERRKLFHESDADFNKMIKKIFAAGMIPILCIGESKEEFEAGICVQTCTVQLAKALKDIPAEEARKLVIAYEPVWAIGTGLTATPEIAQSVHKAIRSWLRKRYNDETASLIRIQYGGSVTPDTIDALMSQPDIDGALVGGASLNAESFEKLVKYRKPKPNTLLSPLSFIYNALGKSTKSVVTSAAITSILYSRTLKPFYYVAMGVVNAFLSKLLKQLIRQPRPNQNSNPVVTEYGMPSSHAQSLFYFTTVIIANFRSNSILISSVLLYSVLAASWRVNSGLHSLEQTIFGSLVGTLFGLFTFKYFPLVSKWIEQLCLTKVGKIIQNKYIALNLLILIGGIILYGPELKQKLEQPDKI